jgi:hypothetical protein
LKAILRRFLLVVKKKENHFQFFVFLKHFPPSVDESALRAALAGMPHS